MNLPIRLAASLVLAAALASPVAMASDKSQDVHHGAIFVSHDKLSTQPKFISGKDPNYTDSAYNAKIEGTVILAVGINEKGKVTSVKVKSPLDKGLDRNAMKAVKKWKFQPATVDGNPVATEVNISVDFRLRD